MLSLPGELALAFLIVVVMSVLSREIAEWLASVVGRHEEWLLAAFVITGSATFMISLILAIAGVRPLWIGMEVSIGLIQAYFFLARVCDDPEEEEDS